MRRHLVALAAALATFGGPAVAHANGRFPAANQLVIAPSNPSMIMVRATFGVLITTDGGKNWDWICEAALGLGPSTAVDPSIGITANDDVIASTFTSLFVSPDQGCTWNPPSVFSGTITQDVAVRADNPHAAFVLTNGYEKNDAGEQLYSSNVFTTSDDGVTWADPFPPIDPMLVLETIDVAPTDPMRLYVSGYRGVGSTTVGVLLESKDGGMSFTEYDVPLDLANEVAPYIAAIDPTNADRVYLRTSPVPPSSPTRVILFDAAAAEADASTALTTLVTTADPTLGFAISPDATKVYVGSLDGGLLVASTTDYSFHQTSTIRVRCLRSTGATLYACSDEVSGFVVGSSMDDGATFTPLLHLSTIRGPLACPSTATDSTAMCAAMWPAQQSALGVTADAGSTSDAGGETATTPPSSKGCGCRAVSDVGAGSGGGVALVGALGLALRRRSRHRAPRRRRLRA